MKAPVYNKSGKEAGEVTLPEAVFAARWNADLVHQVVTAMQANARPTVAKVKGRGEVRGGGRKPWKQKGTGRARHGSSRSPIWRGGGITHGPLSERTYAQKINRTMRAKALYTALSKKHKDGQVLFIDALSFAAPKAKEAKTIMLALAKVKGFAGLSKRSHAALIAIPGNDTNTKKSFHNFGNVLVEEVRNLNPVDVLGYKHVIFVDPQNSLSTIEARTAKKKKAAKK